MNAHRMAFRTGALWLTVLIGMALVSPAAAAYLKINPPADVDKSPAVQGTDNSCWQATAANMLAGAGYGAGAGVQERAEGIYNQMTAHFKFPNTGSPATAAKWWLNSSHNLWPNNPYTDFTVQGSGGNKPWKKSTAPQLIGNELRGLSLVGLRIYGAYGSTQWAHWFTAWGDEGGSAPLTSNPGGVWVADSDSDSGGDVQDYTYDSYSSTNGWRIDYGSPHPTLAHMATLRPTQKANPYTNTQKIVGLYKIHQNDPQQRNATDLHYDVGTDVDILSYHTGLSWPTTHSPPPAITEDGNPPQSLRVDWNLAEDPVPYCNYVTIRTEFVVPTWNSMRYSNVHWTYGQGDEGGRFPGFDWRIETPETGEDGRTPDVSGGYVVGAFDLFADEAGREMVGQFWLQHEYDYFQDPERHEFILNALEDGPFFVGNLRFGHSWFLVEDEALLRWDDWMTWNEEIRPFEPGRAIVLGLDWDGLMAYPRNLPDPPSPGDADVDGDVDDDDLSLLLAGWGHRTDWSHGEFNGVFPVNDDDLSLLLANWTGPQSGAVPEPTTSALLAVIAPALLRLRRTV